MDKITLDRIEKLTPTVRADARKIYAEICEALKGRAICRFSHTFRSNAEQDALYAIGRTKAGKIVTNAKGGNSYHNYGMAIDIVLLVDKDKNGSFESASWETNVDFDGDGRADWREIVDIFKRYGWEWGGDWKFSDKPHFQKTNGLTIAQLKKIYPKGYTE
jgi:peptidoglycan L-alanyl-D-glutamate endopeptidase CwlK